MGKLVERLKDAARSGVYRVGSDAALIEAAREGGLRLERIALAAVDDKPGLLQTLAQRLAFPDWFGGNWDALEDCLTDLSWRKAPGYVLLFDGQARLRQAQADDFGVLLDVLRAAAEFWRERKLPFFAVFVDPPAALDLPPLHVERDA